MCYLSITTIVNCLSRHYEIQCLELSRAPTRYQTIAKLNKVRYVIISTPFSSDFKFTMLTIVMLILYIM